MAWMLSYAHVSFKSMQVFFPYAQGPLGIGSQFQNSTYTKTHFCTGGYRTVSGAAPMPKCQSLALARAKRLSNLFLASKAAHLQTGTELVEHCADVGRQRLKFSWELVQASSCSRPKAEGLPRQAT